MIYGYCRVSTTGQIANNSLREQRELILKNYPSAVICEEVYSGAKKRKLFSSIIEKMEEGDILVSTKLDRFCRSTKEGLEYIDLLLSKKIKIHILNMGLIENTPMGRMVVTNLLAFAEFERAMTLERTQAGKEFAKKNNPNYREGRPRKYSDEQLKMAVDLLYQGFSYKTVMRLTGIGRTTLVTAKQKRRDQEKLAEINQE